MIIILSKMDLSTFVCIGIFQPFTQSRIPPPLLFHIRLFSAHLCSSKRPTVTRKMHRSVLVSPRAVPHFSTREPVFGFLGDFFGICDDFFWISRKIHWSVLVSPWAVPHFYTRAVILFYWMDELLTAQLQLQTTKRMQLIENKRIIQM